MLDTHEECQNRGVEADDAELRNQAMVLHRVGDMTMMPWPMPEVGPDECLVAVQRVGICGSDVHYWHEGRCGNFVVEKPMIIGHESSGIIVRVGAEVQGLKEGDRVAMEPGVPCEACRQCVSKKYNLCSVFSPGSVPKKKQGFFATPPVHGSMARFISHPARFCFKLPEGVSLDEGAMCEPLSVGVYACEQKAQVQPGSTVAIFGAGPIGTICAMVAHGLGAQRIILCDVSENRLTFCHEKCCPVLTLITKDLSADAIARQIVALNEGCPVDCSIDCSGAPVCIEAAITCTNTGGKVCMVGMGARPVTLPIFSAAAREVDIVGVFRYRYTYPKCIEMLETCKLNVMPLITHRFEFTDESVMDAFETCRTGRDGAIKCMIHVGDS